MCPNKDCIYLHDTPSRYLYERKDRAFSPGCIRVENNIELTEILLGDPDRWNQEAIQNALDTNETRKVDLPNQTPVILLYWTVRVDENGVVLFKKDVYKRDQAVLDDLNEEFQIWQRRAFDKND